MRLRWIVLALVVALMGWVTPAQAATYQGPMPRADYPPRATIQVVNPLDDYDYDCSVSMDCQTGQTIVHSGLSRDAHRVTGWVVFSSSHQQNEQFLDLYNVYQAGTDDGGTSYNVAALQDQMDQMPSWQDAYPAPGVKLPSLPDGATVLAYRIKATAQTPGILFVSVAWGPTAEVELFGIYGKGYWGDTKARLVTQVADMVTADPPAG